MELEITFHFPFRIHSIKLSVTFPDGFMRAKNACIASAFIFSRQNRCFLCLALIFIVVMWSFSQLKRAKKVLMHTEDHFVPFFMRHFLVLNMSRTNSFNGYRCSNFLLEMARAAFCTRPFSFNCSVIGVVV